MDSIIKIPIKDVTVLDFEPYGWVAGPQVEWTPVEENEVYKCWTTVSDIKFDAGDIRIYEFPKRPFTFDWMERHVDTYEVLVPFDGNPSIIGIAKPKNMEDVNDVPVAEDVDLFFWNGKDILILNKGIWHTAPFPITPKITYFVVIEKGTPTADMIKKEFKDGKKVEAIFPV